MSTFLITTLGTLNTPLKVPHRQGIQKSIVPRHSHVIVMPLIMATSHFMLPSICFGAVGSYHELEFARANPITTTCQTCLRNHALTQFNDWANRFAIVVP